MIKKRKHRDRDRTSAEIANILAKIKPVDVYGLKEVFPGKAQVSLSANALIVLDVLKRVTRRGMAYSTSNLYDILKYTTDIDSRLPMKLAYRPGIDVVGVGETLGSLWRCGYIRRFCTGYFGRTAGGRPYGVKWLIQ